METDVALSWDAPVPVLFMSEAHPRLGDTHWDSQQPPNPVRARKIQDHLWQADGTFTSGHSREGAWG